MFSRCCTLSLYCRALELLSWLVPTYLFGLLFTSFLLFFAIVRPWPFYNDMLTSYGVNTVFNSAFQVGRGKGSGGAGHQEAGLGRFKQV